MSPRKPRKVLPFRRIKTRPLPPLIAPEPPRGPGGLRLDLTQDDPPRIRQTLAMELDQEPADE